MATLKALILSVLIVAFGLACWLLAPFLGVILLLTIIFLWLREEFKSNKDDDDPH